MKKIIMMAILCALLLAVSLLVGAYPIRWDSVLQGGLGAQVLWQLRLPRGVLALLAGAALSAAGCVYQIAFQNPLASPDVIGTASGASVGAAAAILFLGGGAAATGACAFLGGAAAVLLTFALTRWTGKRDAAALLLAGIAVNAVCQAALMLLKLRADPDRELAAIEFWLMGSLANVNAKTLAAVWIPLIIGFAGVFFIRKPLMMLGMPEDDAQMLGVPTRKVRAAALALATLLTAATISACGIIAFVGLLPPHIARQMLKSQKPASILLSGLTGGALMLAADMAARSLSEIPIGVITSLIGAPALFALLCRKERTHE